MNPSPSGVIIKEKSDPSRNFDELRELLGDTPKRTRPAPPEPTKKEQIKITYKCSACTYSKWSGEAQKLKCLKGNDRKIFLMNWNGDKYEREAGAD